MRDVLRVLGAVLLCSVGCSDPSAVPQAPGSGLGDDHDTRLMDTRSEDAEDAAVPLEDAAQSDDPCAATAAWDPQAAQFEDEVVALTNAARAAGQDCGEHGVFGPAGPVAMEPHLRCAARRHALYMAEAEDDFAHQSRAGTTPSSRVTDAGYVYRKIGENIGVAPDTPQAIVDAWIDSDGHCNVLMQPDFVDVGVGYVMGRWDTRMEVGVISAPYWVQDFGIPRSESDQQGQSK